jgi:NAD-dependent protein deacetylase/lipoamidase
MVSSGMFKGRVLVITGAGISAESGIPTFRGKDGYWRNLDPAKLATPEAFERDPELVWEWYRERRHRIRAAQPNPAHEAIARLAAGSADFLLVTQNVDDLHRRALYGDYQIPPEKIVQIHGDIFVTKCSNCGSERYERDRDSADLPLCQCGELMRPGVVWFGESLDPEEISRVEMFIRRGPADLVVVIGTTALFSYIIDWASRGVGDSGRLVEINPDVTAISRFAIETIREPAGKVLPELVNHVMGGNAVESSI